MCGIFGIVSSNNNATNKLINGLKCLEYRGYDSAGIAVIKNNTIELIKKVGKVSELEKSFNDNFNSNIGIAHSRWATHGKPTEANAHPHNSCDNLVSVVHNGIIENYIELKQGLIKLGYNFKSETDTEVISNLISYCLKTEKNNLEAFRKALKRLKGSFGIAVLFANDNEHIYCAKMSSPLLLGIGKSENYISSGLSAFSGLTNKVISFEDGEYAVVSKDTYEIFNKDDKKINKEVETINIDNINVDKGNFDHFMLKEIFEAPKVLKQTISEYIDIKNKKILFPHFDFNLKDVKEINIISCGTSYYASFIAKYFIEDIAKIKVNIDIASEFRYRNINLKKDEISMFISQSGETADTIGALKLCKEKGQKIISIVNVLQSNIAYNSDIVLKTLAGTEVGVASTKALVGQLAVLYIFAVELAFLSHSILKDEYEKYIDNLLELPKIIDEFLSNKNSIDNIKNIAKNVKNNSFFMFIGRNIYYPLALEGALKLKEINYVPCEGIGAGELKHGPIALIDKNVYVFAINPTSDLFDKTSSNIEEIVAREGKIVLISDEKGIKELLNKTTYNIEVKYNDNKLMSVIECLVPIQLIAYYIALEKGNNIDKPRNLAKSVTVE